MERHTHRGPRPRPLRHPSRPWRDGADRGPRIRQHRHDHRAGADYRYSASLHQLRWLLCAQLLCAARTGPKRLSVPKGVLIPCSPPSPIWTALPESPAHHHPPKGAPSQPKTKTPAMSNQPPSNVPPQDVSNRYDEELAHAPADQPREPVDPSALRNEAQERSRQRPILQKILNLFQKEKADFRELIINSEPLEKRVALLVDGILEKFEIERESDNRMVGGIFKGRIKNLDPGLKAAFVDIGFNKNAFLHYWDMLPAAADSSVEVVRVNRKKTTGPRVAEPTVKDIPGLYPPGTEIVIQVTKGPIGTKGPRTTTNLA